MMQQLLSRIEALAASPEGIASMRDLLRHCAAVEQKAMPPEPASAEALFLEESARRLQPGAKASTLKTRAMPGDKAARDAAAALNLRGEVGAIAAVRKEAERKLRGKSKPSAGETGSCCRLQNVESGSDGRSTKLNRRRDGTRW